MEILLLFCFKRFMMYIIYYYYFFRFSLDICFI